MSTTPGVRRLGGVAELVTLAHDDEYVRAEADPVRVTAAWAGLHGSLAWLLPSRRAPGRGHVVAIGPQDEAVGLMAAVLGEHGHDVGSVSLPRGADAGLAGWTLDPRNDWEWHWTRQPPPEQPHESAVRRLTEADHADIRELLARSSPRHDAVPGGPDVRGWAGIHDGAGRLVACAAHTEHRAGVPHLASVATDPDHRGRGLGAAVTSWLTRRLLADGVEVVTLGMYSDNDAARRVYARLGYQCAHTFTSGRLHRVPTE